MDPYMKMKLREWEWRHGGRPMSLPRFMLFSLRHKLFGAFGAIR